MSAKNTFAKNKWTTACLSVLLLAGAASGGQWTLGESGALVHSDSEWKISVKVTGNDLLVTGIHTAPETPSPLPLDDAIEGGLRIVGIGERVFYNSKTLTHVTIPDSVTNIGFSAFSNCKNLADVKIGNGVSVITQHAFRNCASLTNVTFASGVTHIAADAFKDCSALMRLELPDTVTHIASQAFYGCSGLAELKLPDSVARIEWGAFEDCTGLTRVAIPGAMTYLTDNIFGGCTNLTEVVIPAGVTHIRKYVLNGCRKLANFIVSPENTAYRSVDGVLFSKDGASVLWYPEGRRGAFAIPDGTRRIDSGAFAECVGLTSVTIPDSMEEIGGNAFAECVGLTSVTIPASVIHIERLAFSGCTGLTNIAVSAENPSYRSVDGILFSKDGTRLIQFPQGRKGACVVPDGVKRIGHGAFYNCYLLTSVTLPSSVVNIEKPDFFGFGPNVNMDTPEEMFQEDEEIIYIVPFDGSVLQYCSNLTNITVSAENQFYCSVNGMLLSKDGSKLIMCPRGAEGVCVIPDSVTRIAIGAFVMCRNLTEIFIPDSVTRIDNEAFCWCDNLMKIKIPESVTHIGFGAFSICTSLAELAIPDGVTRIESDAFSLCDNLTTVAIGANVTQIGWRAFGGSGLTDITIPDSVTNIGWRAFSGCDNLTNVVVGSGVTGIGKYAFTECGNLATVFFKGGCPKLSNIDDDPFMISYGYLDGSPVFHASKNSTVFIRESRIADWEPHLDSGSFASGDAMWLKRPVRIWKE